MRVLIQKIGTQPFSVKIFEWGKLISITGAAQVIVQLTGLASGIIIIRMLPTQEYALYTLANTMLGTLTVLADGGISAGVMAQGGKVWQDREKLGTVVVTGLELRKQFAIRSLLISSPILLYLLLDHGASWLTSVLIVVALIPAFFAALSDTLLEIPLKLRQVILPLQKNQVAANVGRLVLTGLTILIFPWACVAVLGGGLPRLWANLRLRKIAASYANLDQDSDQAVRKEIISFVKRILPGALYYCISGQITVWLLSIFGSTEKVAQLGALGRLTVLLNLLGVIFATLITPRFARLPHKRKLLIQSFGRVQITLIVFLVLLVYLIWLFPTQILSVLGNSSYTHLQREFLLMVVSSCISLLAGVVYGLHTSRGWTMNPSVYIPLNIIIIILSSVLLDISTVQGIVILNIIVGAAQLIMNNICCLTKMLN